MLISCLLSIVRSVFLIALSSLSEITYPTFNIFEGLLDNQFLQIQKYRDESNPQFVKEIVMHFFDDSKQLLHNLTIAFDDQHVDYKKLDASLHRFKGSSSSIGAQRVSNICISFKTCCDSENLEGSLRCLQQLKDEYYLVKNKLGTLFRLEEQILAAGGVIPIIG